jgi:hypothetical protein
MVAQQPVGQSLLCVQGAQQNECAARLFASCTHKVEQQALGVEVQSAPTARQLALPSCDASFEPSGCAPLPAPSRDASSALGSSVVSGGDEDEHPRQIEDAQPSAQTASARLNRYPRRVRTRPRSNSSSSMCQE